MTPEKEAFYKKAKEIARQLVAQYRPQDQESNPFGILGCGVGGEYFDCQSNSVLPTIRIYVLDQNSKDLLTKELGGKPDSEQGELRYNNAVVEIVITREIRAAI